MQVTIVGTGYVGLVAGACFADSGNQVVCLDIDADKVKRLQNGEVPIYEPGLEDLLHRNTRDGRLRFTTSYAEAIPSAEIIFLAVGTPESPTGEADLSFLEQAATELGKYVSNHKIIVNKSTVPIGSHLRVREWIQKNAKSDFEVVSNPEFLKEGTAVQDFLKPDRVVIGTENAEVFKKISDLYEPFCKQGNPILQLDTVSAEIAKYACNAFLATRISFMNELSRICEKTMGNVESVRKAMSLDVRIGKHFLYAGAGYGGSCFPKDVKALESTAKRLGISSRLIRATQEVNDDQKRHVFQMVDRYFGGDLKGKRIGVLGLSFKPETDDMREAPSLKILPLLREKGAEILAYDPIAMKHAKTILGEEKIRYTKTAYETTEGSDALLLLTEWNEFKHLDWKRIRLGMKQPVLFDARNIYNPSRMVEQGFKYYCIGNGKYSV